MTLFCKETQCQTLICSACMTIKHKEHDVVDINIEEEKQKQKLLKVITTTIDSLSSSKSNIAPTQVRVDRQNDVCLQELKEEKEKTLNMVTDKYNSLIAVATNQKIVSRSKMTSLEKSLDKLTSIKIHVDKEALTLEV